MAVALAEGLFAGFCPLDAFDVLETVTAAECAGWVAEKLAPARLAMSVIKPKE